MYGKAVVFFAAVSACIIIANSAPTDDKAILPESCRNETFCFKKSNSYPQERIDELIERDMKDYKEIGDVTKTRQGGDRDGDCERKIRFEPIYEIIDKDGHVRFVAQSDKLEQKIRTETCVNPGRVTKSRFLTPAEVSGYHISCVETRIQYSFLALSLDGDRLEDVDIAGGIPVCCACRIKEEYQ